MDEVHATEVEVKMTTEKATSGSELNISALNPDADGDGNVSALEMEIYKALKAADIDGSGSIGTGELYSVIGSLVEEKRKVKSLSKLVAGLIVVIILALASIFGVSMIAGETIKESKVAATTAEMTAPSGSVVNVGQAEDETTLWDMALLTPYQLGALKFFSFYVDLSAVAAYGAWAEFVVKPSVAFKVSSTSATFSTAEGHEVVIDSTANKGTIRFGSGSLAGSSYSIAEALPQGAARKLLEEEPSRTPTIERVTTERRDELVLPREEALRRRRLGRRGGVSRSSSIISAGGRGGRGNRCGND